MSECERINEWNIFFLVIYDNCYTTLNILNLSTVLKTNRGYERGRVIGPAR